MSTAFRSLGSAEDLDHFPVVPFYLADLQHRVSIAKIDGDLYAFDDLCPEHQCPLSAGLLTGTTLHCQCGGCQFDVRSGKVLQGPATTPLTTYAARKNGDGVDVQI